MEPIMELINTLNALNVTNTATDRENDVRVHQYI